LHEGFKEKLREKLQDYQGKRIFKFLIIAGFFFLKLLNISIDCWFITKNS